MNRTNIEHAAFALLIQLPFGLLGHGLAQHYAFPPLSIIGLWWGASVAAAAFLFREHAQYEYKIGDPSKLSPLAGFAFLWRGSPDAKGDFYLAAFAVFSVAGLYSLLR